MMSTRLFSGIRTVRGVTVCSRNIGVMAPALQKSTDPIQQLFVDKIREYKSKATGGKLVEPTPDIEREMKGELDKLAKMYGAEKGVDMTAFPSLKYTDAVVDPIDGPVAK